MIRWSNVVTGFNANDETINFGERHVALVEDNLFETRTWATIGRTSESLAESSPKFKAICRQNSLAVAIDSTFLLFDRSCADLIVNRSFDDIIDAFELSNGRFPFFAFKDRFVFLDLQSSENPILEKQIFSVPSNEKISKIILEKFGDQYVVKLFISNGQILQADEFPEKTNFVEVVKPFKDPFTICEASADMSIFCSEGIMISRNNTNSKFATLLYEFKPKKIEINKIVIGMLCEDGIFQMICPRTFIIIKRLKNLQILDFAFINNTSDLEIVVTTQEEIILLSSVGFKIKLRIPLSSPCYLVNDLSDYEDLFYFEWSNSEFKLKSISLNEPILRIDRLLSKLRFDEAQEFAQKFNYNEYFRKAKVRYIMNELHLRKKEECAELFAELYSLIGSIEDDEFVGECCIKTCVPDVSMTIKFLDYGQGRLSDVEDKSEKIEKQIKAINQLKNMAELFIKIYKDGESDHWLSFSTTNPIVLCRNFLKTERIEEAIMIFERNEMKIKSELSIEMVRNLLVEIPSKVPLEKTFKFLNSFLPVVISVHPESLQSCIDLIIEKALALESVDSETWLKKSYKFTSDCSQLLIGIIKSKGSANFSKSTLPKILNFQKNLHSLNILKDEYNIIFTYNYYNTNIQHPFTLIYSTFDFIMGDKVEHFIKNFVKNVFPNVYKDGVDNLIDGYIRQRFPYAYSNGNWVIPFIECMKDMTTKLNLVISLLKQIPIPINEEIRHLIESFRTTKHSLVTDLIKEFDKIKKKTLLFEKYDFNVKNIDIDNKMTQIVLKIFKIANENAFEDALFLLNGNKNEAFTMMIQQCIQNGHHEAAFSILKSDPDLDHVRFNILSKVLRGIELNLSRKICKKEEYYIEAGEIILGYCGTFETKIAQEIAKEAKDLLVKYKTPDAIIESETTLNGDNNATCGDLTTQTLSKSEEKKLYQDILARYENLSTQEVINYAEVEKLVSDAGYLQLNCKRIDYEMITLSRKCLNLKLQARAYSNITYSFNDPLSDSITSPSPSNAVVKIPTPTINQMLSNNTNSEDAEITSSEDADVKNKLIAEFEANLQSLPPNLSSVHLLVDLFWRLNSQNVFDDRSKKNISKNIFKRVSNCLLDMIGSRNFDFNLALISLHIFNPNKVHRWLQNVSKFSSGDLRRSYSLSLLGKFYTELHQNSFTPDVINQYRYKSNLIGWALNLSKFQLIRSMDSINTPDDKKKMFKMLITIPDVDTRMIVQYLTEMNMDVERYLLLFLEHILVTHKPEFSFQNKKVFSKFDSAALTSKCQMIVQQIENEELLKNALFGQIWQKIPTYYYETFLIVLELVPSGYEAAIASYKNILTFLACYTRVGPIHDSELDCANSNLTSPNLPEIANYRLPFHKFPLTSISFLNDEILLENYHIWMRAPSLVWASGAVDSDLICSKAISNLKNNEYNSEWSMEMKQSKLVNEIKKCIDNIKSYEFAVGAWYYVVNYVVQPGPDQVKAAQLCVIKANEWAEKEVSEKSNTGKIKAQRKYLTVSTMHILHLFDLGKPQYLSLVLDPISLIHQLYHDPSILDETSTKIEINEAVRRIGALHQINIITEITLTLLKKWLEADEEPNGNFDVEISDNVKRACYLLQGCNELANIENELIGIVFPRNEDEDLYSIGRRMRALQCLMTITPEERIQQITARPIDHIKSRLKDLETQYHLKLFNIGFSPLNFVSEPKDDIISNLLKNSTRQKVKFAAHVASLYPCSLKIWNKIASKMLDLKMSAELEEYVRTIDENCKEDIIMQVWSHLIRAAIYANDAPKVTSLVNKCPKSSYIDQNLLTDFFDKK